jgi:hypothetical protein
MEMAASLFILLYYQQLSDNTTLYLIYTFFPYAFILKSVVSI